MQSLKFLTQKLYGIIKSCACANGSVERRFPRYKKEDAASPTVLTEAVFIIGAIEAHDGTVVAYFDNPGANLHGDCSGKEGKFMLLKGQLAELMVLIEPRLCREYVTYSSMGALML